LSHTISRFSRIRQTEAGYNDSAQSMCKSARDLYLTIFNNINHLQFNLLALELAPPLTSFFYHPFLQWLYF